MIAEENESFAFSFLPFKVIVFERPSNKKNLIETHQFVANLNEVFNIDLFFDLENSFNSAFMGFNFRAKNRIGYETGWNKHLLTHKYSFLNLGNKSLEFVKLLENYCGKSFSDEKIIDQSLGVYKKISEEKLFKEPDTPKYIFLLLNNFNVISKEIEFWKKFFDSFERQKIFIWSKDDEEIIADIFSKIDIGKNELFSHRGKNISELKSLLANARQ